MDGQQQSTERRIVRRIRLVVGLSVAVAIGAVVVLVGGLTYLVAGREQEDATTRFMATTLDGGEPGVRYSCLWLFTLTGDRWAGLADAPPGLPLRDTMLTVARGGGAVDETVALNETVYRVHTVRNGDEVRQVVFDTAYQIENDRQLSTALLLAGLVGLATALAGAALAFRAIDPLASALGRQRRFVADASHELRAPLTRLHTRAQLIVRRADDVPEPLRAELRRLESDTRELGEVVEDLLRSARLRSGAPDFERVDLAAVVTDLIAAESGRLQQKDLTARVTATSAVVAGVRASLRRMVSALVDNAIAHTRPGGRLTVTVGPADAEQMVALVVEDDGVGIEPSRTRAVFERFVRGTGGDGPRHGLGLALASEVVDSHSGDITVAALPEGGTRFTVLIPAAPPQPDGGPATDAEDVAGPRDRVAADTAEPPADAAPSTPADEERTVSAGAA